MRDSMQNHQLVPRMHLVNCTTVNGSDIRNITGQHEVNNIWEALRHIYIISASIFSTSAVLLNALSLWVFVNMYRNLRTRKAFHLIFIYLSVIEIVMNYGEIFKIINSLFEQDEEEEYIFVDHNNMRVLRRAVRYESQVRAEAHWMAKNGHDFLRHVFYWMRNWWVAILAIIRTLLATRTTKVDMDRNLSFHRVSGLLMMLVISSSSLELMNRWLRGDQALLVYGTAFHMCKNSEEIQDNSNTSGVLIPGHAVRQLNFERHLIRRYGIIRFTTGATIPFVIIAVCGSIMWYRLAQKAKLNQRRNISSNRTFPTRMIIVFVTVFFCLEMPRALLNYFSPYIMSYEVMYNILSVLSMIDSCANVLIYFFNDCLFRNRMQCLLCQFVYHGRPAEEISTEEGVGNFSRFARSFRASSRPSPSEGRRGSSRRRPAQTVKAKLLTQLDGGGLQLPQSIQTNTTSVRSTPVLQPKSPHNMVNGETRVEVQMEYDLDKMRSTTV